MTAQDTNATVKELSQHQECQAIINWLTPVNYALQQSDFYCQRQDELGNGF